MAMALPAAATAAETAMRPVMRVAFAALVVMMSSEHV
jgi:hypothetical protein